MSGSEFRQTAGIRTLTASNPGREDGLVEAVKVDEGEEAAKGERVALVLPPKSFTLLEAGLRAS